jgi:hypothetical protein
MVGDTVTRSNLGYAGFSESLLALSHQVTSKQLSSKSTQTSSVLFRVIGRTETGYFFHTHTPISYETLIFLVVIICFFTRQEHAVISGGYHNWRRRLLGAAPDLGLGDTRHYPSRLRDGAHTDTHIGRCQFSGRLYSYDTNLVVVFSCR